VLLAASVGCEGVLVCERIVGHAGRGASASNLADKNKSALKLRTAHPHLKRKAAFCTRASPRSRTSKRNAWHCEYRSQLDFCTTPYYAQLVAPLHAFGLRAGRPM
jgi:hypothetical protein